jgi:hypothetical protein
MGKFFGCNLENVTLHVPVSVLNSYKTTAPWSSFGSIIGFEEVSVESITLSQTVTTLVEGESISLTITIAPDDAEDKSISWNSSNPSVASVDNAGKVTAIAPGSATITVTANDGSGVSTSCEVTVKELILGKCEVPTLSYTNGKVAFTCATEDAIVRSLTVVNGAGEREEMEFELIPAYTITAYATKMKYENSDTVNITICWIDCTEEHENSESTDIIFVPATPVIIQCANGVITLTGLADGIAVAVYDTAGMELGTAEVQNGVATIATNLTAGSTAIVTMGNRSVKVVIK